MNVHIKEAANNLLRAAADKRQEEQNVRRQEAELKQQMAEEEKNRKDEIREHELLIARSPKSVEAVYSLKRIHDAHDDLNKKISVGKRKVQELESFERNLEEQARQLESESHSLEMKA